MNEDWNSSIQWNDPLKKWVQNQRQAYHQGLLTLARTERLDEVGFAWRAIKPPPSTPEKRSVYSHQPKHDEKWYGKYLQLSRYKHIHGDCNSTIRGDKELKRWVENQRATYRRGNMRDDRIELLEHLGLQWEKAKVRGEAWDPTDQPVHENRWQERFMELEEYTEIHGTCNKVKGNEGLRKWAENQRTAYRKKTLTRCDRIDQLEELGFKWQLKRRMGEIKNEVVNEVVKEIDV